MEFGVNPTEVCNERMPIGTTYHKKSLSFSEEIPTIVKPSTLADFHRRRSVVGKDFSTGNRGGNPFV